MDILCIRLFWYIPQYDLVYQFPMLPIFQTIQPCSNYGSLFQCLLFFQVWEPLITYVRLIPFGPIIPSNTDFNFSYHLSHYNPFLSLATKFTVTRDSPYWHCSVRILLQLLASSKAWRNSYWVVQRANTAFSSNLCLSFIQCMSETSLLITTLLNQNLPSIGWILW